VDKPLDDDDEDYLLIRTTCSRVASPAALFSGGPELKSLPCDRLPTLNYFAVYSVPPGKFWDDSLSLSISQLLSRALYAEDCVHLAPAASFHISSLSLTEHSSI
jgi:hypothetical protein